MSDFSTRLSRCAAWLIALIFLSACARALIAQSDPDRCRTNLKSLAVGTLMYLQDNDEVFPPTKSLSRFESCLQPYIKSQERFFCPVTGEPYQVNPSLNHFRLSSVGSARQVPLLRDAKPHIEAGVISWIVAYADGHVASASVEPILGKAIPTPSRAEIIQAKIKRLNWHRSSLRSVIESLESGKDLDRYAPGRTEAERSRLLKAYRKQLKQADEKVRVLEKELKK